MSNRFWGWVLFVFWVLFSVSIYINSKQPKPEKYYYMVLEWNNDGAVLRNNWVTKIHPIQAYRQVKKEKNLDRMMLVFWKEISKEVFDVVVADIEVERKKK